MTLQSGELQRIAASLFELARQADRDNVIFVPSVELADIARAIYATRTQRDKLLPAKLFGDPAWDILLDLYIQESDGKRVSVMSACIASRGAQTTALRYLGEFERLGLVIRERDTTDKRRIYLRLSSKGKGDVESALQFAEQRLRELFSGLRKER